MFVEERVARRAPETGAIKADYTNTPETCPDHAVLLLAT